MKGSDTKIDTLLSFVLLFDNTPKMSSNINHFLHDEVLFLQKKSELNPDSLHAIKHVTFEQCTIPILDLRPYAQITSLLINFNNVDTSIYFPPNLSKLVIYHSKLVCMNLIPPSVHTLMVRNSPTIQLHISHLHNLKYFHYDTNDASVLPTLPEGLVEFYCSENPALQHLPELPSTLQKLVCVSCDLRSLPRLPETLTILRCYNNSNLRGAGALPPNLEVFDAQNCHLTSLPKFPETIEEINVQNNAITDFQTCIIPTSVKYLNICGNPIQYYPYIYHDTIHVKYDSNQLWAAFKFTSFRLNDVKVFTPLHLLNGLHPEEDAEDDHYYDTHTSDLFEDDEARIKLIRRLQVMCEIQNQVLCRTFIRAIKEELMARTWHTSRVEAWCGVDFGAGDD